MHSNRLLRWSRIPAARKRRKAEGGEREEEEWMAERKEKWGRWRWRKEKEE